MSSGHDTRRSDLDSTSQRKSQYDGEFNIVYGNPLNGRLESEALQEQSNFNQTWRLINQNGVNQMNRFNKKNKEDLK